MKNKEFMMLQLFAAGDNNDMPVRSYQLEFKSLLEVVFKKMSYFADFFVGELEVLDGVREKHQTFRLWLELGTIKQLRKRLEREQGTLAVSGREKRLSTRTRRLITLGDGITTRELTDTR